MSDEKVKATNDKSVLELIFDKFDPLPPGAKKIKKGKAILGLGF